MHARSLTTLLFCALLSAVGALPTEAHEKRITVTLPGTNTSIIDTGDDLSSLGDLSLIPDGFLEGDSDTGGGSKTIGLVHLRVTIRPPG
jgi:hypothetical protein